jgi:hypothetical protein
LLVLYMSTSDTCHLFSYPEVSDGMHNGSI